MGEGYSCRCEECGYSLTVYLGIGYLYPTQAKELLDKVRQGIFGKRFMEAANNAAAPRAEFSHELYRCGKCGELRPERKISLYDGDNRIMSKRQVCDKCHTQMRITKSPFGLRCPKCKSKLNVNGGITWD